MYEYLKRIACVIAFILVCVAASVAVPSQGCFSYSDSGPLWTYLGGILFFLGLFGVVLSSIDGDILPTA